MGWKDAPAVSNKAAWQAAPEVGQPLNIEIPTAEVLARRKPNKPFETGSDISGKLLDAWEASKLEGLMPEVNPIGGIARQPFLATRATEIASDLNALGKTAAAKKLGDVLSRMGEGASYVGGKIGQIPREVLGWESGKNPLAFNTIYNAAKEGNQEALAAIVEATPLGKKLHSDAIYNYARAYDLPHDVAVLAQDQTRYHPLGLGVHDLIDKQYLLYPQAKNAAEARAMSAADVYKPWDELSDAEKLRQATQAGVDTATWSLIPPRTGENDLGNVAFKLAKKAVLPSIMHVTAPLSSPRIARMAAMLSGKGANLVGRIGEAGKGAYEMLPEASLEDLINAGIVIPKTRNQGE